MKASRLHSQCGQLSPVQISVVNFKSAVQINFQRLSSLVSSKSENR